MHQERVPEKADTRRWQTLGLRLTTMHKPFQGSSSKDKDTAIRTAMESTFPATGLIYDHNEGGARLSSCLAVLTAVTNPPDEHNRAPGGRHEFEILLVSTVRVRFCMVKPSDTTPATLMGVHGAKPVPTAPKQVTLAKLPWTDEAPPQKQSPPHAERFWLCPPVAQLDDLQRMWLEYDTTKYWNTRHGQAASSSGVGKLHHAFGSLLAGRGATQPQPTANRLHGDEEHKWSSPQQDGTASSKSRVHVDTVLLEAGVVAHNPISAAEGTEAAGVRTEEGGDVGVTTTARSEAGTIAEEGTTAGTTTTEAKEEGIEAGTTAVEGDDTAIATEEDTEARTTTVEGGDAAIATVEGTEARTTTVEGDDAIATVESTEAGTTTVEGGDAAIAPVEGTEARTTTVEGDDAIATVESTEARTTTVEGGDAAIATVEGTEARTTTVEGDDAIATAESTEAGTTTVEGGDAAIATVEGTETGTTTEAGADARVTTAESDVTEVVTEVGSPEVRSPASVSITVPMQPADVAAGTQARRTPDGAQSPAVAPHTTLTRELVHVAIQPSVHDTTRQRHTSEAPAATPEPSTAPAAADPSHLQARTVELGTASSSEEAVIVATGEGSDTAVTPVRGGDELEAVGEV